MGLAIGIGFYLDALLTCILTLLVLKTLRIVDKKQRERINFVDVYLELTKTSEIQNLMAFFKTNNIIIDSLTSEKPKLEQNAIGMHIVLKVTKQMTSRQLIERLSNLAYIDFAHKEYM